MGNSIKFRRGLKTSIPTLAAGEVAWCTDTHEIAVGDGATNHYYPAGDGVAYEEGTCTLTLTAYPTPPTTPPTTTGSYTKVGDMVHLCFYFTQANTAGAGGIILITGMPFVAHGTGLWAGSVQTNDLPVSGDRAVYIQPSSTQMVISASRNNDDGINEIIAEVSTAYLFGSITYKATA